MAYIVGCISAFSWVILCCLLFYSVACHIDNEPMPWGIVSLVLIIVVVLDSSVLLTIKNKYKLVERSPKDDGND